MINTNKLAFLPLGETMGLPRNESNSISAPGCKRPPKLQHFFLKNKQKKLMPPFTQWPKSYEYIYNQWELFG